MFDSRIKVAIIIPAYNVEKYIHRAIESSINQTYHNIEIIVVDDGSTDSTFDIIHSYAAKDDRIRPFCQPNGGVSGARNKALDMCQSDYVLFLDSDDWLELSAVKELVCKIDPKETEKLLVSSGCYYAYLDNDKISRIIPDEPICDTALSSEEVLLFVGQRKYNLRSSCYKLFNMSIIKAYNLRFDIKIKHGEDGLFVFEYLKHIDKFIYFHDPLWNILERPGSATTSPYNSSKLSAVTAVEKMLVYDNSNELKDRLQVFLVQRALSVLSEAIVKDPLPKDDIRFLRKKLRSHFTMYMMKQKSFRLRLIYLLETFAPTKLVAVLLERRK